MVKRLSILLIAVACTLSGCVYSGEIKQEGAPPPGEYITVVQQAIDQYRQRTGVLPIKNKEMDTPIYEKYIIDFKKMKEFGFLGVIPTNAFENGGTNIYVLVNPETKPEVKLMDLAAYQSMVKLQKDVNSYMVGHNDQIPKAGEAYPHWYYLDGSKVGGKAAHVQSPYTHQTLSVVIHDSGTIAIDYGPDMARLVAQKGAPNDPNVDLRELLVQSDYYVPARTFAYHWVNGQPLLLDPSAP